jgi:hypothetical protein
MWFGSLCGCADATELQIIVACIATTMTVNLPLGQFTSAPVPSPKNPIVVQML